MSDTDIDLDDTDDDAQSGPKALRDQLKKVQKQMADLLKENDSLKSVQRKSALAELLDKAGAPSRLAKYAERDIEDVSTDTVQEWLKENGEDFGWTPSGADELDDTAVQQQRISRATDQAPQTQPGSQAALLHRLQTEPYATLQAEGLVP